MEEIRGMLKKMFNNLRMNVKLDYKRILIEKILINIVYYINRIYYRFNMFSLIMVFLLWVINFDMGDKYN